MDPARYDVRDFGARGDYVSDDTAAFQAAIDAARDGTLQPGGRFVAMTLARAESSPGRALQAALGTGGITFWTAADLAAMLRAHNLPTRTQQQYGLVMFHAAQAE